MNRRNLFHRGFWGVVSLVASHAAFAGDDQRAPRVTLLPKYKQECAACHVRLSARHAACRLLAPVAEQPAASLRD